jgi:hypothetical protein
LVLFDWDGDSGKKGIGECILHVEGIGIGDWRLIWGECEVENGNPWWSGAFAGKRGRWVEVGKTECNFII